MPDPQAVGNAVESLFESMRDDRLVSIFISDDPKPLLIQQSIICGVSDSFKAALTNDTFEEAKKGILRLQEDDMDTWKIFVHWVMKGEVPNNQDYVKLIKAWGLGDKYQVTHFQEDIMWALFETFHQQMNVDAMNFAFDACQQGSLPRKFLSEQIVGLTKSDVFDDWEWNRLQYLRKNPDYCQDLLEAMISLQSFDLRGWRKNGDESGQPIWMRYMVGEGPSIGQDLAWRYSYRQGRWASKLLRHRT